jgi:RNA polymerase sigma-70 factor, ECF subfamily
MMWLVGALAAFRTESAESHAADGDCLRRMAAGDATGAAALYDRHARAVYSLVLRIVGNEGDAEDVVQEVFAQAWRQAGRYDPSRGAVVAWMLAMARTRALDALRARRSRPEGQPQEGESQVGALPAPGLDAVSALLDAEQVQRIQRALGALPTLQRAAIELAYFEGLTQREIAQRLEQPLGTIKTRIRLGLMRLRDALVEGQP